MDGKVKVEIFEDGEWVQTHTGLETVKLGDKFRIYEADGFTLRTWEETTEFRATTEPFKQDDAWGVEAEPWTT